ncbi:MAG: serine/threonine protein kinase [Polyangiales bacterium]
MSPATLVASEPSVSIGDVPQLCAMCERPLAPCSPASLCAVCLERAPPGYELLTQIGRGGMGVVYRARQLSPSREVALKMIVSGELARESERARFRREMDILAQLDHANIVAIYDGRVEPGGQPFYTMQLVEGGSLDQAIARGVLRDAKQAARLVLTVARAVQHAHELPRPVLHLDIKPSNILLDHDRTPYVADFGLARLLGAERSGHTETLRGAGSPAYMAPERVMHPASDPTEAWDVWSLGAVLYETFTAHPPFGAEGSVAQLLYAVVHEDVLAPRKFRGDLPRDLELVCLTALEKDPARRYPTVRAFADDLERAIDGYPITHPHARSVSGRVWRWTRRHPLVAFGAVAAGLLLGTLTYTAIAIAHELEDDLRASVLRANAYAATMLSRSVLLQMRDYAALVESGAADPALRAHLTRDRVDLSPDLLAARQAPHFDSVVLLSRDGRSLARAPRTPYSYFERNFDFRDYFLGALRHAEEGRASAYVSGAFRSQANDVFKFALAAPIRDAKGEPLGVLMGSLTAADTLGELPMRDATYGEHIAVMLGPRDRESPDEPPPDPAASLSVVCHPAFEDSRLRAHEYRLPADELASLREMLARARSGPQLAHADVDPVLLPEHHDTLPGHEGRWLAAAAPVGGTGYVVLVQERWASTERVRGNLLRALSLRAGLPLVTVLALIGVLAVWATLRRRR